MVEVGSWIIIIGIMTTLCAIVLVGLALFLGVFMWLWKWTGKLCAMPIALGLGLLMGGCDPASFGPPQPPQRQQQAAQALAEYKAKLDQPLRLELGQIGTIRGRGTVISVVNRSSMVVMLPSEKIVWISGVSTQGIVDDYAVSFSDMPMEVVGTRTYATALGARATVFELRPVALD